MAFYALWMTISDTLSRTHVLGTKNRAFLFSWVTIYQEKKMTLWKTKSYL